MKKKNVSLYELCFDRPSLQPLPFPRGIANIHKIQTHKKSTSQFLKAPRACISYNEKLNELNNYNYVWIIYKSSPTTSSSEIRTCTWDVKIDKLIEWLIYSALIFRSVVDIWTKLKINITLTETSKKCTYSFVFKKKTFLYSSKLSECDDHHSPFQTLSRSNDYWPQEYSIPLWFLVVTFYTCLLSLIEFGRLVVCSLRWSSFSVLQFLLVHRYGI